MVASMSLMVPLLHHIFKHPKTGASFTHQYIISQQPHVENGIYSLAPAPAAVKIAVSKFQTPPKNVWKKIETFWSGVHAKEKAAQANPLPTFLV